MARDVFMVPTFRDAGPFDNQRTYRLLQTMADDGSDMDDVLAAAVIVLAALETLSWDQIPEYELRIKIPTASAAANIAANNNVEAFIRTASSVTGDRMSVSVPAWDDEVFDKASNGLLSAAFNTAADGLIGNIVDVKTGDTMNLEFSQSRGIKRGQRLVK